VKDIYNYLYPFIFNCSSNDCSYIRHDIISTFSLIFLLVTLLKKLIFPVNFVLKIFSQEILTSFVVKKNCKKLLSIFLQNILYKTLLATNFVGDTCKFYNFVGNDYPRRNYLPIKSFRKNGRKMSFLPNFFNKFARKIPCNMRFSSSVTLNITNKINTSKS